MSDILFYRIGTKQQKFQTLGNTEKSDNEFQSCTIWSFPNATFKYHLKLNFCAQIGFIALSIC